MSAPSTILMIEPLCRGNEHAQVNAALITSARQAFPADRVEFWASDSHISEVRNIVRVRSGEGRAIPADTWRPIAPIERSQSLPLRVAKSAWLFRAAIGRAASLNARCCVFTAFDEVLLLGSRMPPKSTQYDRPVLAVFHSALAALALPTARLPWRRMWALRTLIEQPRPSNVRIIVLGSSILKEALAIAPNVRSLRAMEHPYLWHSDAIPSPPRRPVHFGSFGGTWKGGVDALLSLQQQVRAAAPSTQFSIIGRVGSLDAAEELRQAGCDAPSHRLTSREFSARAMSVDYAIWLADPELYRFTASGSFLDSLSYVKPGLFLRNPYIETCFQKLGDIGYLCDSIQQLSAIACALASNPPVDRFVGQCRNIINGRHIFDPASVAIDFRAIVEEPVDSAGRLRPDSQ